MPCAFEIAIIIFFSKLTSWTGIKMCYSIDHDFLLLVLTTGIEPVSLPCQGRIMPIIPREYDTVSWVSFMRHITVKSYSYFILPRQSPNGERGGIRTPNVYPVGTDLQSADAPPPRPLSHIIGLPVRTFPFLTGFRCPQRSFDITGQKNKERKVFFNLII